MLAETVHLTGTERRIIEVLRDAEGAVVSWSDLERAAMGYENRNSIRVHLHRLRKKLPDFQYEVVSGQGIRLLTAARCPHCRGTGLMMPSYSI